MGLGLPHPYPVLEPTFFLIVSTYLQLHLGAFDRSLDPPCNDCPDRNGFRRLCYQCPFAVRSAGSVYCERFSIHIRAQEKYALPGWKAIRRAILERDGQR